MPSIFTRRTRDYFQGPDGEQYDKFSTKNKPTKTMFRRLFEAVGFMNESSDTAQTDVQGFVQINTDAEASAKNSIASANGFTKVVQAHHLPHLIEDANVDNPDGAGDANNAFSVRKISTNYGRTGGAGDTYILKNTMAVSTHVDLDFVTVTQSAAGANVELGFNSVNFNTKVGATSTINDLKKGFLGEIKMYSFLNESLGQTNCEFDGQGVGRNAGSHGASGQWAGWVVLMGQSAGILKGTPYNAPDEIIDRITDGANIVDTRQKYSIGNAGGAESGFTVSGSNTHTLSTNETPVKEHYHTLSSANASLSIYGGHHSHLIQTARRVGSGGQYAVGLALSNPMKRISDTTLFMGQDNADKDSGWDDVDGGVWTLAERDYTTITTNYADDNYKNYKGSLYDSSEGILETLNPGHTHGNDEMTFGGSTDNASNSTASAHNNKPLSFSVYHVMYIGTVGSSN